MYRTIDFWNQSFKTKHCLSNQQLPVFVKTLTVVVISVVVVVGSVVVVVASVVVVVGSRRENIILMMICTFYF
jgi:hypothetical protein